MPTPQYENYTPDERAIEGRKNLLVNLEEKARKKIEEFIKLADMGDLQLFCNPVPNPDAVSLSRKNNFCIKRDDGELLAVEDDFDLIFARFKVLSMELPYRRRVHRKGYRGSGFDPATS